MKRLIGIFMLPALILIPGCQTGSADKTPDATGKLHVVATTGMIADMVNNIGGDRVHVNGLMGPGIDPHLYKATAGDIDAMSEADMIVYNGLHLEGKMAELFEKMKNRKATVAVADGLAETDLYATEAMSGQHDPHIWFNVKLWIKASNYLMEQLIELDPSGEATYRENGAAFTATLTELDAFVRSTMGTVPESNRVLVTAHDAFHYFGKAYGVEVRGLQGISTASEAGTADVTELADFLAGRKIPAIFVESSVPTRYMEALQKAVESRGHTIQIGGSLFSDAMGDAGTPEGTYVGMVRHNTITISTALDGGESQ